MTYSLYTFDAPNVPENHAMMLTIPFVAYAIFHTFNYDREYHVTQDEVARTEAERTRLMTGQPAG